MYNTAQQPVVFLTAQQLQNPAIVLALLLTNPCVVDMADFVEPDVSQAKYVAQIQEIAQWLYAIEAYAQRPNILEILGFKNPWRKFSPLSEIAMCLNVNYTGIEKTGYFLHEIEALSELNQKFELDINEQLKGVEQKFAARVTSKPRVTEFAPSMLDDLFQQADISFEIFNFSGESDQQARHALIEKYSAGFAAQQNRFTREFTAFQKAHPLKRNAAETARLRPYTQPEYRMSNEDFQKYAEKVGGWTGFISQPRARRAFSGQAFNHVVVPSSIYEARRVVAFAHVNNSSL